MTLSIKTQRIESCYAECHFINCDAESRYAEC
jgi:hypothetical protein